MVRRMFFLWRPFVKAASEYELIPTTVPGGLAFSLKRQFPALAWFILFT